MKTLAFKLAIVSLCVIGSASAEEVKPKPPAASDEPIDPDVLRKVRKLIRGTLSEDVKDREKAWNDIREMGNLATPGLVELSKLPETPAPMLQSIIIALGDSKDPRAGPTLAGLLKSADPGVRKNTARALGDSNYKAGLAQLEAIALDEKEDEEVRLFAAASGAKLSGEKATDVLKTLAKSSKPEIRSRAVFALGKHGGVKQAETIEAALADADASVREDAVEALRLLKAKPAWAGLIKATNDENFKVRSAAMDALRELTKQKFQNEPKEWQEWYAQHKDDAEPAKGDPKKPKKEKKEELF